MSGLKKVTMAHMLRRVLRNTPGACSSTNWEDVSKPLMPSMEVQRPKKMAVNTLPLCISPASSTSGRVVLCQLFDRWPPPWRMV